MRGSQTRVCQEFMHGKLAGIKGVCLEFATDAIMTLEHHM